VLVLSAAFGPTLHSSYTDRPLTSGYASRCSSVRLFKCSGDDHWFDAASAGHASIPSSCFFSSAKSLRFARRIAIAISRATDGEPGGGAPISRRHSCGPVGVRFPRVRRLHWERAFRRAHDQAYAWNEFDQLVGVRQSAPQEVRNECDPRAHLRWGRRHPFDRLDIDVQSGALSGSAAYWDTSDTGRSMTIAFCTSTLIGRPP